MKFLFELTNEEQLPILYDLTELAVDYMAKTQIIDRWKNLPTLNADATKEDITEATKRNLLTMMKVVCKEYPKETAEICDKMWVLEKDEQAPNVLMTLFKVVGDKDAISFFQSAMSLM